MTSRLTAPARILIVDDHPMMREGLTARILTQDDLSVCGEAATEDEGLCKVKELQPDLVLIDISLKSGNGIDLIKQINSRFPAMKMLVISGFQESLYAERALRAGAMGYVNKQESIDKLIQAIRTVLDGERYVSAELTQRLVAQLFGNKSPAKSPIEQLSNRELEIFRMIGDGLTSGQIAEKLALSTHTIDTHRENIKRKLGIERGAELTRQAVQWVMENRQ